MASQTVECAYSDISGVHVRSSSQTQPMWLTEDPRRKDRFPSAVIDNI